MSCSRSRISACSCEVVPQVSACSSVICSPAMLVALIVMPDGPSARVTCNVSASVGCVACKFFLATSRLGLLPGCAISPRRIQSSSLSLCRSAVACELSLVLLIRDKLWDLRRTRVARSRGSPCSAPAPDSGTANSSLGATSASSMLARNCSVEATCDSRSCSVDAVRDAVCEALQDGFCDVGDDRTGDFTTGDLQGDFDGDAPGDAGLCVVGPPGRGLLPVDCRRRAGGSKGFRRASCGTGAFNGCCPWTGMTGEEAFRLKLGRLGQLLPNAAPVIFGALAPGARTGDVK